ncbi:MarR family transcriptional regulator [Acinetobacter qingfengensis]|uniref:HTH marR-type domain-containing protein n=1 Tax=Acinetobacter qingfengensis TaxID=1262585 RepID=A0A1E7REH9_9GAMM|nr:MarR family transcriptional regulator [Acinetobacter qingfengensis]KAA8734744.1 MarR family transcriptional regulator [Acinetobacter qingfengensis]OEY97662.1 hypothetical protein BJI46_08595 [Acinetobacter qingfengensis]
MQSIYSFRTLLLKSARLLTEQINEYLHTQQLNYSLWQVLFVIDQYQQCTLIDIAQQLHISQPAISKRIFELEQKQCITFIPSNNRREKIVSLSPHGIKLFEYCKQQIDTIEKTHLTQIDPDALNLTKQVLQVFLKNLQDQESAQ